jgi:hypothetical protein
MSEQDFRHADWRRVKSEAVQISFSLQATLIKVSPFDVAFSLSRSPDVRINDRLEVLKSTSFPAITCRITRTIPHESRLDAEFPTYCRQALSIGETVQIQIIRSATICGESPLDLDLLVRSAADLRIDDRLKIQFSGEYTPICGRIAQIRRVSGHEWRLGVDLEPFHLPGIYENAINCQ